MHYSCLVIYFSTVIPADPVTNLSCLESKLKVTVNSPHLLALRVNFPLKVPIDDTLKNRYMTCKSVQRADMNTKYKGENLRHDHVLITVNIFSIKRK